MEEPSRGHGRPCQRVGEDFTGQCGYSSIGAVVGATWPEQLKSLRTRMPFTCFLVPGYGAQGGGAKDVAPAFDKNGLGAVINASRSLMCAYKLEKWKGEFTIEEFDQACREEALRMKEELQGVCSATVKKSSLFLLVVWE